MMTLCFAIMKIEKTTQFRDQKDKIISVRPFTASLHIFLQDEPHSSIKVTSKQIFNHELLDFIKIP
jgi:hypothetical protein